jgi:hypothetical protein
MMPRTSCSAPRYSKAFCEEERDEEEEHLRSGGGRDHHHHHDTTTSSLITALNAEPVAVLAAAVSSSSSNPTIMGEMTWTDNYFNEDERHDDIVAVFDYNIKVLKEEKIKKWFNPWWPLVASAVYVFCFLLSLPIPILLTIGLSLLCSSTMLVRKWFFWNSCCSSVVVWPHTAVTRTGVRHILPSSPEQQGYALDIPFEDIVSIEVQPLPTLCLVRLTLDSTDHGMEYVSSGYCQLTNGVGQTQLVLTGLLEPVRFKKLVVAMKDKSSSSSMPSSQGAQLLSRVEACLNDISSNVETKDVLSKLVAEMREYNQTCSSVRDDVTPRAAMIV